MVRAVTATRTRMTPVLKTTYRQLLRKAALLESEFDALGGTRDLQALSTQLRRTAYTRHSLHPIGDGEVAQAAREHVTRALALPKGVTSQRGRLIAQLRRSFRTATCDDGTPADVRYAFAALRLCGELGKLFVGIRTPTPRSPAVMYNIGQVVYHSKLEVRGAIYGYDESCQMPEEWMEQNKIPAEERTGVPFYHIACEDGSFRYGPQTNLEPVGGADLFVSHLLARAQTGEGRDGADALSEEKRAESARFVYGVLFRGMVGEGTSERLLPNDDLWRRFPDSDGRSAAGELEGQMRRAAALPAPPPAELHTPRRHLRLKTTAGHLARSHRAAPAAEAPPQTGWLAAASRAAARLWAAVVGGPQPAAAEDTRREDGEREELDREVRRQRRLRRRRHMEAGQPEIISLSQPLQPASAARPAEHAPVHAHAGQPAVAAPHRAKPTKAKFRAGAA